MWIGPYGNPSEFKDPAIGLGASRVGWGASGTFTNGGGWAVGGAQKHLQYTMTWPFLRYWQVADLEDLVPPNELLTVLVATSYEVNAIPPQMTDLSVLGVGTHNLSVVPAGEPWQFSWEGEGTLSVPGYGQVGPGLYDGVGTGEWFAVTREEPAEPLEASETILFGGNMVLTFGNVRRYEHRKIRGQGNTGMRLKMPDGFQVTPYSAPSANDYSSVSIGLIETGAWE